MSARARVVLKINGRVQGVFFRLMAQKEADKLGLSGWVRNNGDGSVECLAEGDRDKLGQLVDWCAKGPEHAMVDKIEQKWQDFSGEFNGFKII